LNICKIVAIIGFLRAILNEHLASARPLGLPGSIVSQPGSGRIPPPILHPRCLNVSFSAPQCIIGPVSQYQIYAAGTTWMSAGLRLKWQYTKTGCFILEADRVCRAAKLNEINNQISIAPCGHNFSGSGRA